MKYLFCSSVLAAASFAALPSPATARPTFVQLIPSGSSVQGVQALGHRNAAGGGALNAFGEAFKATNYQWTTAMCQADSDGDGATNGEELGDPCCSWQPGSATSTQAAITHPGVANSFSAANLTAMRCLRASGVTATGRETQPDGPADAPVATEPSIGPVPGVNTALPLPVAVAGSGSSSLEPSASPMPKAPSPTKEKSSASETPVVPTSAASPPSTAVGVCVALSVAIVAAWSWQY